MTKWEYNIVREGVFRHTNTEKELNSLGKKGWELINMRHVPSRISDSIHTYYILKRPLPEKKATTKKTTKKT